VENPREVWFYFGGVLLAVAVVFLAFGGGHLLDTDSVVAWAMLAATITCGVAGVRRLGAPRPPGRPPRLIEPPTITNERGERVDQPRRGEDDDFPDVQIQFLGIELANATPRLVTIQQIRVVNRSDESVSLSFKLYQPFARPAVDGTADVETPHRVRLAQVESGPLPGILNLDGRAGDSFTDQSFEWTGSDEEFSRLPDGHVGPMLEIVAIDVLTGREASFFPYFP